MTPSMSRVALIELVERIMRGDGETTEEADRLVELFLQNVPDPGADDLIFYPLATFGHEPTADEVVDRALSYKPIQL
jgi:hypothetical protein